MVRSDSATFGKGPLYPDGSASSGYDVPLGEMVTWGNLYITNDGSKVAEFTSLEVLDIKGGVDVVWLGLDMDQSEASPGVWEWPPYSFERLIPADSLGGVVLEPGDTAQGVVAIMRTSKEHGRVTSVEVKYSIDDVNYEMVLKDSFYTDTGVPIEPRN